MNDAANESIRQFLSFHLGNEIFAVEVAGTREVLNDINVTKVPQTPDFLLGVINLRGSVVPVIDLRLKFGMEQKRRSIDTCIIVLEVDINGETIVIGVRADSVREVLGLGSRQIKPPPRLGKTLQTGFIKGMGDIDGTFVIILDINELLSSGELDLVRQVNGRYNEEVALPAS